MNVSCHYGPVHCLFLWYASPDLYIKFIVSEVTCASLGQLGKRHISWPCNHSNHLLIGSRQPFHPLPLKASMWDCWLCLWLLLYLHANMNVSLKIPLPFLFICMFFFNIMLGDWEMKDWFHSFPINLLQILKQ